MISLNIKLGLTKEMASKSNKLARSLTTKPKLNFVSRTDKSRQGLLQIKG